MNAGAGAAQSGEGRLELSGHEAGRSRADLQSERRGGQWRQAAGVQDPLHIPPERAASRSQHPAGARSGARSQSLGANLPDPVHDQPRSYTDDCDVLCHLSLIDSELIRLLQ